MNEEFDRSMEMVRPAEPEFYNKYFAARIVKDSGLRHKANGGTETAAAAAKNRNQWCRW